MGSLFTIFSVKCEGLKAFRKRIILTSFKFIFLEQYIQYLLITVKTGEKIHPEIGKNDGEKADA